MAVVCKLDAQHEHLGLDFERFLGDLDTRLRNDDRLLFGSQNDRFLGDLDTIKSKMLSSAFYSPIIEKWAMNSRVVKPLSIEANLFDLKLL